MRQGLICHYIRFMSGIMYLQTSSVTDSTTTVSNSVNSATSLFANLTKSFMLFIGDCDFPHVEDFLQKLSFVIFPGKRQEPPCCCLA